jgi:hypothetical protein
VIEICAHAFRYPRLLAFHLSGYVLHPPETETLVTICYSHSDSTVTPTLDYFGAIKAQNVEWRWLDLPHEQLMRRAIGRNMVCRTTDAEYLLLSDIDYILRGPVLDAAVDEMRTHAPYLFYPRVPMQSISHEHGDAEIERVNEPGIYELDESRYTEISIDRPIGGCQWYPGDVARQKGYLPKGHKFLSPEPQWRQTRCDKHARGYSGLDSLGLSVEGVYRIRHSDRGRFNKDCVL